MTTVNGVDVTGTLSVSADEVVVLLEDGRKTTIPAGDPLYDEAAALSSVAEPPPVPQQISNAQARAALRNANLLTQVQATINAASDAVKDAWEYSPYISRDSTLVATLGAAIGLTGAQIDALFIAAAAINF